MQYAWQQIQWRRLLSVYAQDRLPHALLLAGPSGLGKNNFAKQFAQYVFCVDSNKIKHEQACQQCSSCRLVLAGTYPDLLFISPEEDSKNIKIDQIRQVIHTLSQTAQRDNYQIVILSPAEYLNTEAANALLKTLEEPSGKVLLLLVSHHPQSLPMTLLSRCQKITFTPHSTQLITEWLAHEVKKENLAVDDIPLLLKSAYGAPLQAINLITQDYFNIRDRLLLDLISILFQKSNPIASATEFLKSDFDILLQAFFSLTLDLLRLQLKIPASALTNQDRASVLMLLSKKYSSHGLIQMLEALIKLRQIVFNHSAINLQLSLENILISWKENAYAAG